MAERPPATDLRGGKASEDSFTMLMANLVVAYAVDFQSGSILSVVAELMVCFGGFEFWLCPVLKTDRIRSFMVWRPMLHKKNIVR